MFGISYGELFILVAATAALIGPKDLPLIARTTGRMVGRAIGYVQSARGEIQSILQQSQVNQVHKELQDTMAQLDAIRHEIRSISFVNPGPLTKSLMDDAHMNQDAETQKGGSKQDIPDSKDPSSSVVSISSQATAYAKPADCINVLPNPISIHSQATAYAKLAESANDYHRRDVIEKIHGEGLLAVLPVSAESAGLLHDRKGAATGSDVLLEAILEAEVARNAKRYFELPSNTDTK